MLEPGKFGERGKPHFFVDKPHPAPLPAARLSSPLLGPTGRPRAARGVRASTWAGRWTHRRWAKGYLVGVEDPFDASDNCARSIAPAALPRMVATFAAGADVLQAVPNERGAPGSVKQHRNLQACCAAPTACA